MWNDKGGTCGNEETKKSQGGNGRWNANIPCNSNKNRFRNSMTYFYFHFFTFFRKKCITLYWNCFEIWNPLAFYKNTPSSLKFSVKWNFRVCSAFLPNIDKVSKKTQLHFKNLTLKKYTVIIKDLSVITKRDFFLVLDEIFQFKNHLNFFFKTPFWKSMNWYGFTAFGFNIYFRTTRLSYIVNFGRKLNKNEFSLFQELLAKIKTKQFSAAII